MTRYKRVPSPLGSQGSFTVAARGRSPWPLECNKPISDAHNFVEGATSGEMGPIATVVYKLITSQIAEKCDQP